MLWSWDHNFIGWLGRPPAANWSHGDGEVGPSQCLCFRIHLSSVPFAPNCLPRSASLTTQRICHLSGYTGPCVETA
jgi:hypothetical protein